jgi:hypothetical protein
VYKEREGNPMRRYLVVVAMLLCCMSLAAKEVCTVRLYAYVPVTVENSEQVTTSVEDGVCTYTVA